MLAEYAELSVEMDSENTRPGKEEHSYRSDRIYQ